VDASCAVHVTIHVWKCTCFEKELGGFKEPFMG
jgi:hypothetical protein